MKLKKAKQDTLRFAGNYVLFQLVDILCRSLRINIINRDAVDRFEKENVNYVLAFWHGTMLLPWFLHRNKNFAGLTSKSKDGDLLARILKKWKYKVLRGSSSEGGDVALGLMIDFAKNGYSIAVTPDGPKGPPFKMKAGAVVAAKKAGLPLVLLGVGFRKKRLLKSWDRFQVPMFFTSANVVYSKPIFIGPDMSRDEISKIIEKCESKLNELQRQAEKF